MQGPEPPSSAKKGAARPCSQQDGTKEEYTDHWVQIDAGVGPCRTILNRQKKLWGRFNRQSEIKVSRRITRHGMVWIDAPISNTKKRWTDRPTGWWTCSRGEEGLPFSNWHRTPDYRTYYITIVDDYPVNHDCIWLLALNIQWWLGHPSDPNAVMIADGVVDVPQCVSVTWPTKVRLEQARATPSASCPAYSGARGPRNLRMWNVFGNYTMDKSNRFPVWNWIMTRFSVCVLLPLWKAGDVVFRNLFHCFRHVSWCFLLTVSTSGSFMSCQLCGVRVWSCLEVGYISYSWHMLNLGTLCI